ncbi:hypothetical protein ACIQU6_39205 [Streptomyces sp. NPDC090442]|uniref:hypothetical protein n=1 Tax=Streptomyces sp. NPDC090442 TaxID=3365962 RepID=UPI003807200A
MPAAEQAAAVLAVLKTVPVQANLLPTAAVLLEGGARACEGEAERAAAGTTVTLLHRALDGPR